MSTHMQIGTLAVLAGFMLLASPARADVAVTATSHPQVNDNGTPNDPGDDYVTGVTFDFDVSGLPESERLRDMHFVPDSGTRFPPFSVSSNGTELDGPIPGGEEGTYQGHQTWQVKRDSGGRGLHIYSTTSEGFTNGTTEGILNFKKNIPIDEWNRVYQAATWKATKNGQRTYQSYDVIAMSSVPNGFGLPQLSIAVNDGDDLLAALGQTTTVSCAGDPLMNGASFEVYTSLSLAPDYDDELSIGIQSETEPIPSGWGLEFHNWIGTLSEHGVPSTSPSVEVPSSSGLHGQTFYLVFAVKDALGEIEFASTPIVVELD